MDKWNEYTVTGELENPGNERVEDVRAIVLAYDKDNNLINVGRDYPEPDAIPPHDTVSYKVKISHFAELIDTYNVIGYSMQW